MVECACRLASSLRVSLSLSLLHSTLSALPYLAWRLSAIILNRLFIYAAPEEPTHTLRKTLAHTKDKVCVCVCAGLPAPLFMQHAFKIK